MNYIDRLPAHIKIEEIEKIHYDRQQWVSQQKKGFLRYRTPAQAILRYRTQQTDCTGRVVTIGSAEEISPKERKCIHEQLRAFMPWRKGPYSIFGIDIDAEWQSDRKWARLEPFLPDLKGKTIADIGCSNGYYMFRMVPHQPACVLGFEPAVQPYYCFKMLNGLAGFDNLNIDLLGVEHISLFPESFDLVFLMGVIYHRPSPVDVLKDIRSSLKPGGCLILESQAIPGNEPVALFPKKTYAKVPGTYFIPTGRCLENWMIRAGFNATDIFCSHPMNPAEQRQTDWMIFESYQDFINPQDPSQTIEGYPAPHRVFLRGFR
ncbi:MAG: tRNA 5-methoxyuridine(34)/uridine 5-oxyacetic acid(34) synthase CmoB [Proteobacteria bacterium]|nr:MAG: tRNA 5-methoxyuridine(34)/uridine 5-oxyacetic acid(34) synthase CmoB [Pseudomonadota bacterium]PIE64444.1 MAG: tRNA 5-methoxyuridine(34)/uridine 5-oxyacetic acid(34) synthase CmoB [Desulfobacterales bacterium]